MSAHIERRVQSALRAVIPEISAAIAAEMKLARRRKRHSEVSPDRELEPGEASVYAPERMRSRQRSRPPRVRSSTREGDLAPETAPEPHAPQPSNAPGVQQGRCVAVHVLTGDASPDTIATQHRSRPSPNMAPNITPQSEHLDA
jgi:hypothetical protein